jgi:hypothetical protein
VLGAHLHPLVRRRRAIPAGVAGGAPARGAALATLALCAAALRAYLPGIIRRLRARGSGLLLVMSLALLFRLPLAWWGAAGYITSDGALHGIMAVHLRDGVDHPVFVPHVGYSGSLKAHVAAVLSAFMDMPRALALTSIAFYALFVGGLYSLALAAGASEAVALAAGLYGVFAPAWVTHYGLSNDGTYVDLLALGRGLSISAFAGSRMPSTGWPWLRPWASCWAWASGAMCWPCSTSSPSVSRSWMFAPRRAPASLALAFAGFVAGYFPGLLWNAGEDWFSFGYLIAGSHQDKPADLWAFPSRIIPMVTDHWPILLGYDSWYPRPLDRLSRLMSFLAVAAVLYAGFSAARSTLRRRNHGLNVLLIFAAVNLALALVGSAHIPGNPRYLLFLMTPIPVFLALAFAAGWRRWLFAGLLAFGALGSLATFAPKVELDGRWRAFVARLESEGVTLCHSDYYLATKINFLSEERVVCSSRLGPTTADYFRYGERVDAAGAPAAFIPVNGTRAGKIAARLAALGVRYERVDLMKPVLLRLSRRVDPDELRAQPDSSSVLR